MRAVWFGAGVLALAGVLSSPFDALADRSFAWHMTEHVLLTLVAAPLLLLADPVRFALHESPRPLAKALALVLRSPIARVVTHPFFAGIGFVATLWGTHFSALYELSLENGTIHVAEHALYLGTALLFWGVAFGRIPWPLPLPYPYRTFFVFLAIPFSAALGLAIYSATRVLYPHYAAFPNALADQQNGGEVMWVGGGLLMFVWFMYTAVMWMQAEVRAGEEIVDAT
jgi:putative membrane protein